MSQENLTLLEQHIFKQNQSIIELSARLKHFCDSANSALDEEEKSEERIKIIKLATAGVVICAAIFGGAGYLVGSASNAIDLTNVKSDLKSANAAVEESKTAAADFEKRLAEEKKKIGTAAGWAGTPEGKIAKAFFDSGWGIRAATCNNKNWEIEVIKQANGKTVKQCVLKAAPIFGDAPRTGWEIP